MQFHNISFNIDNFAFIVLTIILLVFDFGMSSERFTSGKRPEKAWNFILKIA